MNFKFVKSGEKKRIVQELEEKFGISKINGILIETAKEKIRIFTGTMTKEEIIELCDISNVEIVGLYIVRRDRELRLSFDATQVLSDKIEKGILEISEIDVDKWMNGYDLDMQIKPGIYVLQYAGDNLGCGVSNGEKVINFVPKERRIRRSV